MKVALAQVDTRVGDFAANRRVIVDAARAATAKGRIDLVVFPEMVVTGYPPRDLLLDEVFVAEALASTEAIARDLDGLPPVLLGTVARAALRPPRHPGLHDVAALLHRGRVEAVRAKRLLPPYDVFHEPRWFVPGGPAPPLEVGGWSLGILVCEDLWAEGYAFDPGTELKAAGARVLICISASPFRLGVLHERLRLARRHRLPLVYVNAAGANDELVFDGGGFALDAAGGLRALLPRFAEGIEVADLGAGPVGPLLPDPPDDGEAELFRALVVGVEGFARKNGLRRAFLGLSGGIDSALVACIAREALGTGGVTGIALPTRFNDPRSTDCARELAGRLGIAFEVAPMEDLLRSAEAALGKLLDQEGGTVGENLQARLRMVVLMAFVNRHGGLLLNTSNKTELTLGYGTLYGDMSGTLSVLGDLTKTQVYQLARWFDRGRGVIPRFVLERPPSAELRPDQVDPFDYAKMSPLAEALVHGLPLPPGTSPEEAERVRRLLHASEHKRRQAGIVLKVSEVAFGSGRMMPVTRKQ